ncbi:phage tail protein [Citrobacter sp. Cpo091]|uniref:phage tail protein n=1 Tax=Citrobacter sp. Cpo091 TaxID=2985140 RepID=UPI0025753808|nr:phage tail protein [Citrobacter sp. Cpo091]MDM2835712.1 phage tail protein [Citrobacter sp. Cpo091]
MPKFKTVITTVGAAKIAAVLAGTGSIVLDSNARMAVGDGNGTLPTPDPAQAALVKEVYRAALNTASIDASNPKNIIAELIIPPDKGGFWMREMALYDAAGTLLAVGNMAETYKPSLSEGAGRKQVIRMVIAVSDVTAVTITMDSSTVMATQDYVDSKLSDHEKSRKHPDATLTDKGFTQLSSETDSVSEAKAATPKAVKTVMDAVTTKAPTASPALTGTPTAPTAPSDTNSTQLATTAFVVAALARLVNSSPAVLDTLGELAAALGNDPNFATTMTNALANKQPLDATLTSLAGLVNGANKLPYFTGTDQMATADLSAFIRTMLGKGDAAAVLQYLGLDIALAAKQPLSTQLTYFANHSDTEILQYLGVPSVISAAISSLVDSSPAALDTLNELAEALGNDPHFSTTVINALAGKQPLDATLTGLSGKNDAGLRAYLSLKSAATRDVGSVNGQLPGMDLFASTIAGTGEKALPDSSTGTGMFILKWGAIAAPTTSQDITTPFQTPFPSKCLRVFATADYEPGTGNAMYIAVNNSTLQRDRFVARFAGSANYTSGVYFALGY